MCPYQTGVGLFQPVMPDRPEADRAVSGQEAADRAPVPPVGPVEGEGPGGARLRRDAVRLYPWGVLQDDTGAGAA